MCARLDRGLLAPVPAFWDESMHLDQLEKFLAVSVRQFLARACLNVWRLSQQFFAPELRHIKSTFSARVAAYASLLPGDSIPLSALEVFFISKKRKKKEEK